MPVLKMLSRRSLSAISHTLDYIIRDNASRSAEPILHNLRSLPDNRKGIAEEFIRNEAYRKITSNRVYVYHSILSLSELDREHATPEVMETIANKYYELRGDILGFALPHFDTESPHLHILESATYYRENRATGLRKTELQKLKNELELFVREKFPELKHSLVMHGTGKEYVTENEYQLQKRKGSSERETLKKLVHEAYQNASSKQQFLKTLHDYGYIHYERNSDGVPTGVISDSGRKYRFKILGIFPEQIMALESDKERSQEQSLLEQLKSIRQKNHNRTLEK